MKSILFILFNTRRGLDLLDDEFEDELRRKSAVIFSLYAVVEFLFHFTKDKEINGFIMNFFDLIMNVFFSILIGTLSAYILFKIGQWLGGKANYIEIFSLLAYTYVPLIIALSVVGILKNVEFFQSNYNNANSRNLILCLSWFFSYKILVQGFTKFNEYGIKKAMINSLPIAVLGIYDLYIVYDMYKLYYT
ncbi:YIP1 family protein [uncultured Tenacibaculum sp.]|uniref:YIP1 family protein n=1 Tax=uncultured Tenacibaculum sp. TaxID=174713 RepID=UPI00261FF986|nr:YIP1 family protein [uncultured Tenacibaculum sp.]